MTAPSSLRRPKLPAIVAKTRHALRATLKAAGVLQSGKTVMIGLSGGADSLALAAAAAHEARKGGFKVITLTVDHNLQEGSFQVACDAAAAARSMGVHDAIVYTVEVDDSPAAGGPEKAARDARYEAFAHIAAIRDVSYVLTAHTKQDQAEQVLLGLVRGSGTKSLAGIPPKRGIYLRPFLTVSREETVEACRLQNLTPWNDPHNVEEKFLRVRVRKNVLPAMQEQLGGNVVDALATTADIAREDSDLLDSMAEGFVSELKKLPSHPTGWAYSVKELQQTQHPALRNRVLRLLAEGATGEPMSRVHTLAVAELLTNWHGQGSIDIPGGTALRKDGALIFRAR